jgi:hypothetical protein
MKENILKFLSKLGVLNDDQKVSITNIVVYIFLIITAFRGTFAGATITTQLITWKVEPLDMSSTLPLLFSLLNYSHKRTVLNHSIKTESESQ